MPNQQLLTRLKAIQTAIRHSTINTGFNSQPTLLNPISLPLDQSTKAGVEASYASPEPYNGNYLMSLSKMSSNSTLKTKLYQPPLKRKCSVARAQQQPKASCPSTFMLSNLAN